jgi:hypothetical protein
LLVAGCGGYEAAARRTFETQFTCPRARVALLASGSENGEHRYELRGCGHHVTVSCHSDNPEPGTRYLGAVPSGAPVCEASGEFPR